MTISIVGLDADDTLWHNETIFRMTHDRFSALLAEFADAETVEARLAEVERRNIGIYGYGAKGFTLSMLETALAISERKVSAATLDEILTAGREMMGHPIEPLPGVVDALAVLNNEVKLVLITKGDLFHQETKLAASGLGDYFEGVEIVSEKTADTYRRVFVRYGEGPETALMAGNSVKSDILPALQAGAYAALIPYHLVWAHEAAEAPATHPRYRELATLADLPAWIAELRGL